MVACIFSLCFCVLSLQFYSIGNCLQKKFPHFTFMQCCILMLHVLLYVLLNRYNRHVTI